MSYTILKSDGTTLTTIADGTVDTTSTNLSIPGPNYVGYGQKLNENLVYLLENFASNSAPLGTNIQGQLWFNKSNQTLNVFTNQGFAPVSGVTNSGIQPATYKDGDIWYDSSNNQMYLADSGIFKLVGPLYNKSMGVSGAIPTVVNDGTTIGVTHNIIEMQFGNVTLATFSSDLSFIPSPAMPGFPRINPGITINSNIASPTININVVGSVTGNVTGSLVGAEVVATNVYGNLTGNVAGNLVGTSVIANTLTGSLTGNTSSIVSSATNFSSANAQITSGNITGLTNLTATTTNTTSLTATNAQITSGNITGLTNLTATSATLTNTVSTNSTVTTLATTNFSSSNAQITGGNVVAVNVTAANGTFSSNLTASNVFVTNGNITGLVNLSATSATFANLVTTNLTVISGNLTELAYTATTTAVATNFSSGNAVITGGAITATPISGSTGAFTTAQANNFSSGNAVITGGSANGLTTLSVATSTLTVATVGNITTTNSNVGTLVARNFSSSNVVIAGGTLNATQVGLSTPAAAAFTTVSATGIVSVTNTTASTSTGTGAVQVAGGLGVTGAVHAGSFNGSGTGLTGTAASLTAGAALNGGVTSVNGNTGAITIKGLGFGGETWHDVTGARSSGTVYTNNNGYPIAVSAGGSAANSGPALEIIVNGVQVSNFNWQFNGAGAHSGGFTIVPPGATYQLIFNGSGIAFWSELY
jgi:hypothetical protein